MNDFHVEIDALVRPLEERHRDRLRCARGCHECCVDDISVFEVEASIIRQRHADVLKEVAHPPGKCAFLNVQGECRIYESRPYVCRTQGLPLRWTDQAEDGSPLEYRDICHLNEDGPLITDLTRQECWTLGPSEMKLQALQREHDPAGALRRVELRSLFTG